MADRTRPRKWVPMERECTRCGALFMPNAHNQKRCSQRCTKAANRAKQPDVMMATRWDDRERWAPRRDIQFASCLHCHSLHVVSGTRTMCGKEACRQKRAAVYTQRWSEKRKGRGGPQGCVDCGAQIEAARKRLCADCARQRQRESCNEKNRRRDAVKRAASAERFSYREVYKRDKWTCWICGKKVLRNRVAPHPRSPSIDHVVALSHVGGPGHTKANVRCACLGCNVRRGAAVDVVQMAMIG